MLIGRHGEAIPLTIRTTLLGGRPHEADRLGGGVPLQPVVHATALHELHEVVLCDAGCHVPSAVDGEVRPPRQRQVQPDEGGLLVAELRVPEVVWQYDGRVSNVVCLQFQHGGPLLRGLLDLRVALLVAGAVRGAGVLRCARGQRF